MPLDAIALGAIAIELDDKLKDAKIEKIHQPERDEILLVIKSFTGTYKLAISASGSNARMHLVDESKENPTAPPMFCMLLRKHLTGGRIISIRRMGYERVVDIELSCRNELGDIVARHIICEIMGRNSNIIFLDENRRIIDSVKHIDLTVSTVRNILPGLTYMMPPTNDRLDPSCAALEDYYNLLENMPEGREIDRAITEGVMGISPLLSGECVYRAIGIRNAFTGELSFEEKRKIASELFCMFQKEQNGEFRPCILYTENREKVADFAPFEIKQYEGNMECVFQESMNGAANEFYFMRDRYARMRDRSSSITKVVSNNLRRAEKKLNILQGELKEAEKRDYFRICGDIISANLYRIQKGDSVIKAQNFYDENQAEIEIKLDTTLSPSKNADKYYTKYKKAKNTELYAKEQINKTVDEIEYLESVLYSVSNAQTPQHLSQIRQELVAGGYIKGDNQKKKKEKQPVMGNPMEFSYKGYTIYVGRNNVQNDYLTLRMGRSRDLWLHTKNIPGSHTLVKFMGEDFPNEVIEKAAEIAAFYSKGKNSSYVEVDYCPVSHVKKPAGAKAGMVIYEGYNTALVKPSDKISNEQG